GVDRNAGHADIAGDARMIRIVAAMGGEIEGDRQALLAGGEVAPVEGVGILRRGEAGILPDGPGLVDVHGRVGAAQIRRDARPGIEEVDVLEVSLAIGGLDRNAFRREPRFCGAGGRLGGDRLEGDVGEIRNAAHGRRSFNSIILLSQLERRSRSSLAAGPGSVVRVRKLKRSNTLIDLPKALILRVEMYAVRTRNTTEKMTREG